MNKFLIQEARWLKGNSTISTIYSFQLLVDKNLYKNDEVLYAYIEYLLFFEYESLELVRSSSSVRDDEYSFPSIHELQCDWSTLHEVLELLKTTSDKIEDFNDPVKMGIAAHLRFRSELIKSFMLLTHDASILKSTEEIMAEEQEALDLAKIKNKKKAKNKKKNKKKQAAKEINWIEESFKCIENALETYLPIIKDLYDIPSEKDKEAANALFDSSIMRSINMVVNLSNNLTDMTYEQAFGIVETMCNHIKRVTKCTELRYIHDILLFIQDIQKDAPVPLVRWLLEHILFPNPSSIKIFGKFDMHQEFLRRFICDVFSSIWTIYELKEFQDFLFKFSLMTREYILRQLKNISNQKKNQNRYYEDLSILISEANYTDDILIDKKKYDGKKTMPCLTLSINLVAETMLENLCLGIPLDLYAPYEFAMIFHYLSYISTMLQNNRRIMIIGFWDDLYKKNQINFEAPENEAFNKKRK